MSRSTLLRWGVQLGVAVALTNYASWLSSPQPVPAAQRVGRLTDPSLVAADQWYDGGVLVVSCAIFDFQPATLLLR